MLYKYIFIKPFNISQAGVLSIGQTFYFYLNEPKS